MARTSPLHDQHAELDANFVDFGGWDMPIAYPSGTLDEHVACRTSCALFDVSHLGTVRVTGPDALDSLQAALSNDLGKIGPGRAQYTHLLDDNDASVLDDIIVWWHPDDDSGTPMFDVMPNASNTDRVLAAIGGTDITAERAVIAVQGPNWAEVAAAVEPALADVGRFRVARVEVLGTECVVAGTGYTGERGIEIAVPVAGAAAVWQALVAQPGATPAGLGARDTLRLEAALPLHGHELGPGITSLQAGLGWVVAWDKPGFRGRDAALAERERGVHRRLIGMTIDGRRPARADCDVLLDGAVVGRVTSGNFAPSLGHAIALAFVDASSDLPEGAEVTVDVRGKQLAARIAPLPFI